MTSKQLSTRLSEARACPAILDALARLAFRAAHGGEAECPAHRIPSASDLSDWLPRFGAWPEIAARLRAIGLASAGQAIPVPAVGLEALVMVCTASIDEGGSGPGSGPDGALVATAWQVISGERGGPATLAASIETAHGRWSARESGERGRGKHPVAPLVDSWQHGSGRPVSAATVSAVRGTGLVRRDATVSRVLRAPWDLAGVSAARVDGEPMATRFPDETAVFGESARPRRRVYAASAQRRLGLRGIAELPADLRLSALSAVEGGPAPAVLAGDVLALMSVAHASDRPIRLGEREGAALLARSRDGGFRRALQSDIKRFWRAAEGLYGLLVYDPRGTGRWANLARVDPFPQARAVEIGAPEWMRGADRGRWTLTAEGGIASRARVVAGEAAGAGRLVTALEHYLGAYWIGEGRGASPYLRPDGGKGSAGPIARLPWRTVMMLAGYSWDPRDSAADHAMRSRFQRFAARLMHEDSGYRVPGGRLRAEAPAGDSVEVLGVERGKGRWRGLGLRFRASARFVEAARLASLPHGEGFETVALGDWMGLPAP